METERAYLDFTCAVWALNGRRGFGSMIANDKTKQFTDESTASPAHVTVKKHAGQGS